ncbi:MAG: Fe-S cluster assembly protein SufD [Candidatus Omnitrophica bacterium]|nr:Fe-S cluster assembly protein SufD [Candidatus Omnitrophota bacterium]
MAVSTSSNRLKSLREEALNRFESLPWPVKTDEEWRRTDPSRIPLSGISMDSVSPPLLVKWEIPSPEIIQAGVILTDLDSALRQFPQMIEEYLFQTGTPEGFPKFVALHQALWKQGLFCYVPDGVRVELPLRASTQIVSGAGAVFPHTLIVVGQGAEVTLIDERYSQGNGSSDAVVSDEMVEIFLKPGANLRYVHPQQWAPSVTELFTQRVLLDRDAQFFNVMVTLGGRLTKGNVETVLSGTGCRSELLGILFGSGSQHFDFHTLQDHQAKATFSDLLYKSALKDTAKAIYTGLIRIRKEAQKSDAYQANRNLLLSQGAQADSIPILEIEADDVRCTHGVAVGPIDPEQEFYLMSRGLPSTEAQRLIVEGFFEQVFKRIPLDSLREQLMAEVTNRLSSVHPSTSSG